MPLIKMSCRFGPALRLVLPLLILFWSVAPAENYRSVETDHFRLHYSQKMRPYAEWVAQIAEGVHDTLSRRYGIDLKHTTEVVLENSLLASGYANPATDRIAISATDWGFMMRSQHDWLRNVVTHEYSHILSLARGGRVRGWLFGVIFSYADYAGEMVQQNGALAVPFRSIPVWFSEGTAQYETERMGFDAWDAHRDMIMRRAVLDTSLFSLSEMGQFAELREIDLERAPYTQGYSMVRYIGERWGDDSIVEIWKESSRWSLGGFSTAIKRVTGLNPEQLYEEWKQSVTAHYSAQRDSLGNLREGRPLTKGSWLQDRPRYDSRGRLYFLSNLGSDAWSSSLVRLPADTVGLAPHLRPDSAGYWPIGAWRWGEGFKLRDDFMERGYAPWVPSEGAGVERLAYVTFRYRDAQYDRRLDIVVQDSSEEKFWGTPDERRVTRLADAVDPDYRRDGRALLYVSRDLYSARFSLWSVALDSAGAPSADPRLLMSASPESSSGAATAVAAWNFGIYSPRWSPSGERIALSWFDGKNRRVRVIDTLGNSVADLSVGGNDERDPDWIDDTTLVISSNRGGVFNLWQVSLAGGEGVQLTRMLGGAFSPTISPDRSKIAFIGYDRHGFSLRELNLQGEIPEGGELTTLQRRAPLVLGGVERSFSGVERAYHPLPSRLIAMPILAVEERARDLRGTGDGIPAFKVGFNLLVDDPLQHNQVSLMAMIEVGAGLDFIKNGKVNARQQKDLFLSWENRSFPIVSKAGFLYRNMHAEDTLISEDKGHPTSVVPISTIYKAVEERLEMRGFSLRDTVALWGGWESGKFDLYKDRFSWDFYSAWRLGTGWTWASPGHRFSQREPLFQPSGLSLAWMAEHRWAGLFRTGKFYESFVIDESGAMPTARLRDWRVVDFGVVLYSGIPWRWGVASLQCSWRSVPWWSGDEAPGDSLDSFFHPVQRVAGYPLLRGEDDPLLQGAHVAQLELRQTIPLWSSHFTWGGFAHRGSTLSIYAQAGRAASHAGGLLHRSHGDWLRGVGLEWRFSQRIFYGVPLEFWVGAARALDRIPGGEAVPSVVPKWVPDAISATSLEIGVGLQFWNPGVSHRPEKNLHF